MTTRLRTTLNLLWQPVVGMYTLIGAAVVAGWILSSRWIAASVTGVIMLTAVLIWGWWRAGRAPPATAAPIEPTAVPPIVVPTVVPGLRRDLLPKLIQLETEAREFIRKLSQGDGNAPAPALMWCRDAAQWFREEAMVPAADILHPVVELAVLDYSQPIHNRKGQVEMRAQLVVVEVLDQVQQARDRIHSAIEDGRI